MDLSIIMPVFNEQDNIEPLINSIQAAMATLNLENELIFVDDRSTDDSVRVLQEKTRDLAQPNKIIELRRNYGQTAALTAGIDHSSGKIIVLLDADLQNDPADISLLLHKMDEGFDVVSGWRKDRKDNYLLRTLPSIIANKLISMVTGVALHDYGCTLKAYRREFLTSFNLYGEMHRFIPVFAVDSGAKITEVLVHHHPRRFGKSKYGIDRVFKVILDLFTVKFMISYAVKPIRLFGSVGMALMGLGSLILLFLLIRRIFLLISVVASPFFMISIMIFIMGFQSILMGLIAELLMRTYYESQDKSIYTIRSITSRHEE